MQREDGAAATTTVCFACILVLWFKLLKCSVFTLRIQSAPDAAYLLSPLSMSICTCVFSVYSPRRQIFDQLSRLVLDRLKTFVAEFESNARSDQSQAELA
jgi:hypothetical protein